MTPGCVVGLGRSRRVGRLTLDTKSWRHEADDGETSSASRSKRVSRRTGPTRICQSAIMREDSKEGGYFGGINSWSVWGSGKGRKKKRRGEQCEGEPWKDERVLNGRSRDATMLLRVREKEKEKEEKEMRWTWWTWWRECFYSNWGLPGPDERRSHAGSAGGAFLASETLDARRAVATAAQKHLIRHFPSLFSSLPLSLSFSYHLSTAASRYTSVSPRPSLDNGNARGRVRRPAAS